MNFSLFVKVQDNQAVSDVLTAQAVSAMTNKQIYPDGMNDVQLAAAGFARVSSAPYPQDGYIYTIGPAQKTADGWMCSWVQQPTPGREVTLANQARFQRQERDRQIKEFEWRYARHARNARLGLPQVDDIDKMDAHVQALADVPTQEKFPWVVEWPVYNP